MKIMQIRTNAFKQQHGMVTMFFVLMLMFLMGVLALTAGKFAIVEQESAGADYRSREAAEATTAGLEYALAWLDDDNECSNCVTGTPLNFEGAQVANTEMPDISYTGTGYVYNPTVTLTQANNLAPGFMLIKSSLDTVTGSTESGVTITGSEQVYVTQWNRFLAPGGRGAPPIVINGCMVNTLGNPTVYPRPDSTAILSVATNTPVDWTDPNAPTGYCLDPGHMDIELCSDDLCPVGDSGTGIPPGDLEPYLQGIDLTLNAAPQAWNYIFEISLADAKVAASAAGQASSKANQVVELQPSDDNYVPFIHYTGKQPLHGTFGSIDYPVVVIMSDSGCPQFNGGSTVYGFLYYENPLGSCNGMGGATVVGSGVFEGNAVKLNANTEFYDAQDLGGGNPSGPLFTEHAARIPGSWRDW